MDNIFNISSFLFTFNTWLVPNLDSPGKTTRWNSLRSDGMIWHDPRVAKAYLWGPGTHLLALKRRLRNFNGFKRIQNKYGMLKNLKEFEGLYRNPTEFKNF